MSWELLTTWLAGYYLQASGLLIFAAAALLLTRSPARRLALSWAAVAGLLVLPLVSLLPGWPRWSLTYHAPDAESWSSPAQIGMGFLIGAGVASLFLTLGAFRTAGIVRRSRQAPRWFRTLLGRGHTAPAMRESSELGQAIALGTLHPLIVVPEDLHQQGSRGQLRYLLCHEWAHIRHGDLWLLLGLRLLLPLLFAHPLYWWLRAQIREDQEFLADADAAGTGDAIEYAEALLHWSRLFNGPAPAAALGYGVDQLGKRIRHLLHDPEHESKLADRSWKWVARLGMAGLVLALSLVTLAPHADVPLAVAEVQSRPHAPREARLAERDGYSIVAELAPMPVDQAQEPVVSSEKKAATTIFVISFSRTLEELKQYDWRPSVMLDNARQRVNTVVYRWLFHLLLEWLKQSPAQEPASGPMFGAALDPGPRTAEPDRPSFYDERSRS